MTSKEFLDIAEQKYRPLKKRLKGPHKKIATLLEQGEIPGTSLLDDYMALVEIMISYPGFGDEQYDTFWQACQTFQKACTKGSLSEATTAFEVIKTIKHQCHEARKRSS